MTTRRIIAISDLHIGKGPLPTTAIASQATPARQIPLLGHPEKLIDFLEQLKCFAKSKSRPRLELVIHGDFIDFLAEPAVSIREGREERETIRHLIRYDAWTPWHKHALRKLDWIVEDYGWSAPGQLFFELKHCIQNLDYTTILLGNHDVELSYPQLRNRLLDLFEVGPEKCRFLLHNEPYHQGPILIEHGDRYDSWNAIDRAGLRAIAARAARGENYTRVPYTVCAGSRLVAELMNYVKENLRFVDILKPDEIISLELLRQIYPGTRDQLRILLRSLDKVSFLLCEEVRDWLKIKTPVTDRSEMTMLLLSANSQKDLADYHRKSLPPGYNERHDGELADRYCFTERDLRTAPPPSQGEPGKSVRDLLNQGLSDERSIACRIRRGQPLAREEYEDMQELLLAKLRPTRNPQRDAAKRMLAERELGLKLVVMGHTHLACEDMLGVGTYVNTGTWADVLDLNNVPWLKEDLQTFQRHFDSLFDSRFDSGSSPYFLDVSVDSSGNVSPAPKCNTLLRAYNQEIINNLF